MSPDPFLKLLLLMILIMSNWQLKLTIIGWFYFHLLFVCFGFDIGSHFVALASLELRELPLSASCVLKLKVYTTTPHFSVFYVQWIGFFGRSNEYVLISIRYILKGTIVLLCGNLHT